MTPDQVVTAVRNALASGESVMVHVGGELVYESEGTTAEVAPPAELEAPAGDADAGGDGGDE